MNELSKDDILDALRTIPPSQLNYTEWVTVGMALKDGGFDLDVWDNWSKNDTRYSPKDCSSRWNGFKSNGVTVGSIIHMAQHFGWSPYHFVGENTCFDWESVIQDDGFEYIEKENWNGTEELIEYLETMFKDDEYVSYVSTAYKKDNGKFVPNEGVYYRTKKELVASLKKSNDITDTIGTYDKNVGAWIRFNPVDGKGIKNDNVTRFKYALVESDTLSIQEQEVMYRKFELPIEFLIYSGGKSLHAIVKVDAKDKEEYRKRVEYLYDVLKKEGMEIDTQNRNPSRLSRLCGVMRNGKRQYIVDRHIGRSTWNDWLDFIEGVQDELPHFVTLDKALEKPHEMPEEIIENILRKGHKMLISGDSKAGKSWLMMELAIATAEGLYWAGEKVKQGRVLYINLEIDSNSFLNRFDVLYPAMLNNCQFKDNIYIWNLRGNSIPIEKLVSKIIRRTERDFFSMIILDPIYKVQVGDENKAGDIADFCNQLDRLATYTNSAVVYCHHHSKGSQGGKKMMDRASGSGVFSRDADAIIDLIELEVNTNIKAKFNWDSAFQMEFSLREFGYHKPVKMWFHYPLHILERGELKNCFPEGSQQALLERKKWAKERNEPIE